MKVLHLFTIASTAESFFDGQFKFLTENGYETFLFASTEPNKSFIERNHIKFKKAHFERKIDIPADLKAIKETISLIRTENPDVIFGHTPKGALIAMISGLMAGVPKRIYYRHGLIYTTARGVKRILLKSIEQITSLFATHIINVSPSLSDLAIKDYLNPAKKQIVIGKGTCGGIDTRGIFNPEMINTDKLDRWKGKLGLREVEYVVGFCGRLSNDKGIKELVAGFKRFKEMHPDICTRLLLVGPMDSRDTLPRDTISEIESNRDIIATGMIDKRELPYMYQLMDVFVFPSYREGFGMCVIEASAMERPILVSRSHGCVDSIIEGDTGEYIEINPGSIASGLTRMLNADLRKKYGIQSRKWVVENFDHSVLWPKILKFYRSLQID